MNIEAMLKKLRDCLPNEQFKIQPDTARQELLNLEKTYNMNTKDFFENPRFAKLIPVKTCDTFITFGGSMDELNHLITFKDVSDEKK